MTTIDPGAFDALTFDCYGTLIDWETGLLAGLRGQLGEAAAGASDAELLEAFAAVEHDAQNPYRPYREVLATCLDEVGAGLGASVGDAEREAFAASVGDWPAFEDSAGALARLGTRYRLCAVTNCDDDLFALSAARLETTFDEVVTAQQVGAYKPDAAMFRASWERLGLPPERILHVAQSLFHDHVPAKALGMTTVWVNRYGRAAGATPGARAEPDVEVADLRSLADLLVA